MNIIGLRPKRPKVSRTTYCSKSGAYVVCPLVVFEHCISVLKAIKLTDLKAIEEGGCLVRGYLKRSEVAGLSIVYDHGFEVKVLDLR